MPTNWISAARRSDAQQTVPDLHRARRTRTTLASASLAADSRSSRVLKKARNRLLTRAAQNYGFVFAATYRAATVRERFRDAFFSNRRPLRPLRSPVDCLRGAL